MYWEEDESALHGFSSKCKPCPADYPATKGKRGENTCKGCGPELRFDHDLEKCVCPAHGASKTSGGKCECPEGTDEVNKHGFKWCACPKEEEG